MKGEQAVYVKLFLLFTPLKLTAFSISYIKDAFCIVCKEFKPSKGYVYTVPVEEMP